MSQKDEPNTALHEEIKQLKEALALADFNLIVVEELCLDCKSKILRKRVKQKYEFNWKLSEESSRRFPQSQEGRKQK